MRAKLNSPDSSPSSLSIELSRSEIERLIESLEKLKDDSDWDFHYRTSLNESGIGEIKFSSSGDSESDDFQLESSLLKTSSSINELKFVVAAGARKFSVTFYFGSGFFNADCDCQAAMYGNFCQHRLKLLRGDGSEIVSSNVNQLESALKSLPGTRLDAALSRFEIMASRISNLRADGPSAELDQAELEFKAVRRKLSVALMQ